MLSEWIRDGVKIGLAVTWTVLLWRSIYHYRVSDAERRQIRSKCNTEAHEAWSALRQQDMRDYECELDKLRFEIAARDAVIADLQKEVKRWNAIAESFATGRGKPLQ